MKNEEEVFLNPRLPWRWWWQQLSPEERRSPNSITARRYELARRDARALAFPDWRHRPGPEVRIAQWPPWTALQEDEQAGIVSVLNPMPPPASFLIRPGQEELPTALARTIDIEDYIEVGRQFVRRNSTDNELGSSMVADVRQDIPAPVHTPASEPKVRKITGRPSRPRSPGSKTNDPSWRGLEVMDLQFHQIRELTTAEKKLLARTRQEARRWHHELHVATHI